MKINILHTAFPFLNWFQRYRTVHLKADLVSGLTVALVLIPQSMAYAQLAGLPSYYGLYASFLPPVVAAMFGSSRQLSTGPVAVVALMTAVAIEPLATAGSTEYIAYAILLSLIVGLFQFLLGVLRLGMLVNLLSHPVINGFSNAAAIIIASSQLPKIFGVEVDKSSHHYETVLMAANAAFHYTHLPTLIMAFFAFFVIYGTKKISTKFPSVLITVVAATLISWATGFEKNISTNIDSFRSPSIKPLVRDYNKAVLSAAQLTRDLHRIEKIRRQMFNKNNHAGAINASRDIDLIHLKIKNKKNKTRELRKSIRSILLRKTETKDNKIQYYIQPDMTRKKFYGSDIWRIKVRNGPINPEAINLSGGGTVVGAVPKGLPYLSISMIDFNVVSRLFPLALIIAVLGFMEAVSVAKAMAAKTGQRIDPNQELIGQGLGNIAGSFGQSFPCAGSFSRSALNLQSGAITGMASLFSSISVVVTLYFFTSFLYHLPQAVLAAIIMVAVIGLINIKGLIHAWHTQWYDGAISVITFISTLLFAPHLDRGILIGIVLSLAIFVFKNMRPKVVDLSMGVDLAFHDAVYYGLKECKYIGVVRFDGPLFFANAGYLEDQIRQRRRTKKELKHIIIASDGINDIDASGEETLSLIIDRVRSAGIDISFSGINESVLTVLERTHLLAKIGKDHVYPSMEQAITAVHSSTHKGGIEKDCPLTSVCFIKDKRSILCLS